MSGPIYRAFMKCWPMKLVHTMFMRKTSREDLPVSASAGLLKVENIGNQALNAKGRDGISVNCSKKLKA
jgi:hypothetical protein